MKSQVLLPIAVLVAFGAYTLGVVLEEGYTGFITLAWAEPWAGQMFVDLVIALGLFLLWMWRDASREGLSPWPYAVLVLTTGSIGALAYLVHRGLRRERSPAPATA